MHDILHEFIHVKEATKIDYADHKNGDELPTYKTAFGLIGNLPAQNGYEANNHFYNFPGGGKSANTIRGVRRFNPLGRIYHEASNRAFKAQLYKYTGAF